MFVVVAKKVNKYNNIMCYSGYWISKEELGNIICADNVNISVDVAHKLASVYKLRHLVTFDKNGVVVPYEGLKVERFTTFGKVYNGGGLKFYHKDDCKASELVNGSLHTKEYNESEYIIENIDELKKWGYDYEEDSKVSNSATKKLIADNCIHYLHECINQVSDLGCQLETLTSNDVELGFSLDCNIENNLKKGLLVELTVKSGYCIDYSLSICDKDTKTVEFIGVYSSLDKLIVAVKDLLETLKDIEG